MNKSWHNDDPLNVLGQKRQSMRDQHESRNRCQRIPSEATCQWRSDFLKNEQMVSKAATVNGESEKIEVKSKEDKYKSIQQGPIEIVEIQRSDSASEVTTPDDLIRSIATSFFGFRYKFEEVTQPELEISWTPATSPSELKETGDSIATTIETNRHMSVKENKRGSTMLLAKECGEQVNVMMEANNQEQTEFAKMEASRTPGESTNGKDHNNISETREPDTPINSSKTSPKRRFRDEDKRDDHLGVDTNHAHHHDARCEETRRPFDKYAPLQEIVKDSSRKELSLLSARAENKDTFVDAQSGYMSTPPEDNSPNMTGIKKEDDWEYPVTRRRHKGAHVRITQPDEQVRKSQVQVFRQERSLKTPDARVTSLVTHLTLDGQKQTCQTVSLPSPTKTAMSPISSEGTLIRPGSLRL